MKRSFWGTLGVPLFLWAAHAVAANVDPLKIQEERGHHEVRVWAENTDSNVTRWAWLELIGARNIRSVPAMPLGVALRPGERRLVATLSPFMADGGFSYGLRSLSGEGDPTKEPDPKAVYLLPYAHGTKRMLTQGYFGRVTHAGLNALDFDLPEGTEVRAARGGIVYHVKDSSSVGGLSGEYAQWGNSIDVIHADGTWAVYAHLKHNGARVQVGQQVQAGDLLGYSGATGMANGPHLHFAVYKATWQQPKTVPTVFQVGVSTVASLVEGQTYYAYRPGGPPFKAVLGSDLRDEDLRGVTRTASGGKVKFREEKVDNRVLIYCANGTKRPVDLTLSLAQQSGVKTSVGLPFRARVPARTEAYMFAVDYVGPGKSGFQLSAQIMTVER